MLPLILSLAIVPSLSWQPELPAPGARGQIALADGRILMPGRASGPGTQLGCFASSDEGKTWTQTGVIVSDPEQRVDLGDGNIVQTPSGELWAVYRHIHAGAANPKPDYAVEVSVSKDGGATWQKHSTVALSRPNGPSPNGPSPSRGLWSPLLFVTDRGDVQCYYDDENTPFQKGFPGHQWLTMKTYSARRKAWEAPVTVARAYDRRTLSRDGMAAVVQLGKGEILCAFESVQAEPPHAGLIRMVTSHDEGRTWSWSKREREVLYQPRDRRFHAFSPAIVKLPDGDLVTFFATNEDRPDSKPSGTPAGEMSLDIKYVASKDGGKTWDSSATLLYAGTHRNYLPGVVLLRGKPTRLFASFLDFDQKSFSKVGALAP